ncbi:MAG TPA: hypothetical protein DCO79_13810 [Spirochaeta sp.]|nr:hypothetical protein [Spirochaeta sp.]
MKEESINNLKKNIAEGQQSIILLLKDLISFKTVTSGQEKNENKQEFLRCADYVKNYLENTGFEAELWDVQPKELKA